MLSEKNRLKKKKDFNFIYKKGVPFFSKNMTLYVANTRYTYSKIGFSVSNKVGNSVVRHKVKRRLSEIVRLNINKMIKNSYVFVVKQSLQNLTYDEIKDEFFYLIKKARVFKNEEN